MNKFLAITALLSVVFGVLGFYIDLGYVGFFRISFLIVADIFVILLIAKMIFAGNNAVKKYNSRRVKNTANNPSIDGV